MVAPDFIYPNPPLVEVIADLKWALSKSESMPGMDVDLQFKEFQEQFIQWGKTKGFAHLEILIPEIVPRELLAHQPTLRMRKNENTWPLFQLGPGIMTINQVPPYEGWSSFSKLVGDASDFLCSRPTEFGLRNELMLELRYIDAFTKYNGMENEGDFIREYLKLFREVPQSLINLSGGHLQKVIGTGAFQVSLDDPPGVGIIEIATGASSGDAAVIMNVITRSKGFSIERGSKTKIWFERAHEIVATLFNSVISEELKASFGEPIKIGV